MKTDDPINSPIDEPAAIRSMFNAIAPAYDRLNHLLSFGFDIRWRKKTMTLLREKRGGIFLDIACGSGDFAIEALNLTPARIIATDFADTMLDVFRVKLKKIAPPAPVEIVACDALSLPFAGNTFDVTMVAFGIRNFGDRSRSLREMHRVLKPGGISAILELSTPRSFFPRHRYLFYSNRVLPLIGRVISRHNSAYRYLPESIAHFPDQKEFIPLMESAGFTEVQAISLTFGTATIYLGRKPA